MSDIGWWMRLLCQHIAVRANRDDKEVGKFWQSRFRAVRLLDEAALVACAAYVDLNPIRAAMAKSLESSNFTSVQRRIQSLPEGFRPSVRASKVQAARQTSKVTSNRDSVLQETKPADRFLSPLKINESADANLGPYVCKTGHRCSNKGFLPLSRPDYLSLLEWTARQMPRVKRGLVPRNAPQAVQRLGFDGKTWCELVQEFGQIFRTVAGRPRTVDATRSRVNQHRFHLRSRARELLTPGN